jgi:hypothetical protein
VTTRKNTAWLADGQRDIRLYTVYKDDDTTLGEIWWKKNSNEKCPKINFYISASYKEESWPVSPEDMSELLTAETILT